MCTSSDQYQRALSFSVGTVGSRAIAPLTTAPMPKTRREGRDSTTRHTSTTGAKVSLVATPRPAITPSSTAVRLVSQRPGSTARATRVAVAPAPRASATGSAWTRESEKRVSTERSGMSWNSPLATRLPVALQTNSPETVKAAA